MGKNFGIHQSQLMKSACGRPLEQKIVMRRKGIGACWFRDAIHVCEGQDEMRGRKTSAFLARLPGSLRAGFIIARARERKEREKGGGSSLHDNII